MSKAFTKESSGDDDELDDSGRCSRVDRARLELDVRERRQHRDPGEEARDAGLGVGGAVQGQLRAPTGRRLARRGQPGEPDVLRQDLRDLAQDLRALAPDSALAELVEVKIEQVLAEGGQD